MVFKYVQSDYYRYKGKLGNKWDILLYLLFGRNHCFNYSFWLRLASRKNILFPLAVLMHRRLTVKYGIQIPHSCKIGYGLYIGHGISIVISGKTIIGNNCNISQFLTIGSNKGTPAIIGDNVYIGPSVCLIEDVHIGNNVTIGAGSVVTKSIPDNATVAGVPTKILSYNNPAKFINRKYPIGDS